MHILRMQVNFQLSHVDMCVWFVACDSFLMKTCWNKFLTYRKSSSNMSKGAIIWRQSYRMSILNLMSWKVFKFFHMTYLCLAHSFILSQEQTGLTLSIHRWWNLIPHVWQRRLWNKDRPHPSQNVKSKNVLRTWNI